MQKIVYSGYQKDIFDAYKETDNDLLIQAVAGSGKTFTITELSYQSKGKTLFLAFNKNIAEEISKKVPGYVNAMTLHSLGCKSITNKFGNVKINPNKTYGFIIKNIGKWDVPAKEKGQVFFIVSRLVDLYRLTLCNDVPSLEKVAMDLGINFTAKHIEYTQIILKQLERYNRMPQEIDFTDMIYLPATSVRYELPRYDNVFIDECQDLNNAQHTLVDRLTKRSRVVFVGDEYQAIYGFAGANSQSFERLREKRGIKEMPLSVCYRCPIAVIEKARNIYPMIEQFDQAVDGYAGPGEIAEAEEGDMVICRNLKPLISIYFNLIVDNKKAYIKGKDIGQNLIRMIKPYEKDTLYQMSQGLIEELKTVEKELSSRGISNPKKHPSYEKVSERVGAIMIISNKYNTVPAIIKLLEEMFKDDAREGVMLSTIHKAKGLEADNVFFVNKHLIPSKYAETQEQLEQENNLLYVATTRAKQRLVYITIND